MQCNLFGGGVMICSNCDVTDEMTESGFIKVIENFGPHEDDETHIFCSYSCMKRWFF
jgi:hypothetical protein